jgi:hypothetical protein
MKLIMTRDMIREHVPCRAGLKEFLPMVAHLDTSAQMSLCDECVAGLDNEHKMWALVIMADGSPTARTIVTARIRCAARLYAGAYEHEYPDRSDSKTMKYWYDELHHASRGPRPSGAPTWVECAHNALYSTVRIIELAASKQAEVSLEERLMRLEDFYTTVFTLTYNEILTAPEGVTE